MLENGGNACFADRTEGDSTGNEAEFSDHSLTTAPDIFHSAEEAAYSQNGYWLTKRKDGRSGQWMIARYQAHNRSTVYRSCRTADLSVARRMLDDFAGQNPTGVTPISPRLAQWVYFIQAATGQVKIGTARCVQNRLSGLRTMSPVGLTLLATTEGGRTIEAVYHARFAEHRLHGEWFEANPAIMSEVDRILSGAL